MTRTCSNCSLKLSSNDNICPICQTPAGNTCANCSSVLAADMRFCENCGSPSSIQTVAFPNTHNSTNKNLKSNKNLPILIGSILGVCVIGLASWFFMGKRDVWLAASNNVNQSNQNLQFAKSNSRNENSALNGTNSSPIKSSKNITFTKRFSGYVNNIYVEVEIHRDGNTVTGTINESGRQIQIEGTIDDDNNFKLDELDDYGEKTGIYRGKFNSQNEMEGNWSLPNGAKPRSFRWTEN
jgi:RNA polymerase subunit RPABC4/transcription elongation factor Spt4